MPRLAAIALVCLALTLVACEPEPDPALPGTATFEPTQTPTSAPTATPTPLVVPSYPELVCTWAEVAEVTDGDTLTVRIDGEIDRVRFIGVDTPEIDLRGGGVESFGMEAAAFVVASVAFPYVCLEADFTDRDDFDRLLRYAWLPDGRLLNEELLRQGLALINTFPPDVRHLESRYLPAQEAARQAGLGVWALEPTPEGQCDPAYPGVCIPSPPPDLDCGEIAFRRFIVRPPDPHRFDADGNGVGCEG